jgi:hypothetical protein
MGTLSTRTKLILIDVKYYLSSTTWVASPNVIDKLLIYVVGGGASGSGAAGGTSTFGGIVSATGSGGASGGVGQNGDINILSVATMSLWGRSGASNIYGYNGQGGGWARKFIDAPTVNTSVTVGARSTGTGNHVAGFLVVYEFAKVTL